MVLEASTDSEPKIQFSEIGEKAGVRTVHQTRRFKGEYADVLRMFTSGGAASAIGDYDNDGLDDLFVTDSNEGRRNHLFRNEGNLFFSDQTEKAGVGGGNDPLSVVADALFFDYDNDGWADLLVCRFGTPILYHNQGDGTFKDVSATSGLNKFGNSIAVITFDYNNDGFLDLMFGHYFKPVNLLDLSTTQVLPHDLDNASNGGGVDLWRNTGKGSFVEVTKEAGFGDHTGWTLDIGHGDFDNDGLQDVYLACDYGTDRIFFNNGDGTFRDATEKSIGFDTKKGMNAEVADYNNDGFLDVYVTNITDEYMKECNMLWHNNGDGTFTDLSKETGTCDTLWGWGAKFGDFDNDGWLDLFAVNGLRSASEDNYIPVLVEMIITPGIDFSDLSVWPEIKEMTWSGFQKSKFFKNLGVMNVFKEVSAEVGVDNDLDGRGVALSDFDGDGLLEIYQTNADQPALLYHNTTENPGNWVGLKLVGTKSNRDAIGARITLRTGNSTLIREVVGGNGYSAQSTNRVHFGIGNSESVQDLQIRWPSGQIENLQVPVNQWSKIVEGKGLEKPSSK
jgi:hypothetical protein